MPDLQFLDILIISPMEKKAKRVEFVPGMNLVLGENDTGKSSLLKSLYWCLGAEIQVHPRWTNARVKGLLHFDMNDTKYYILRDGKHFTIFDDSFTPLYDFKSITNELTPFLAPKLGFAVKLADRQSSLITPPPGYMFLPFYIDQDRSWNSNWDSFLRLQQFSKWKKPLVEYFTGIYPNEYFMAQSERVSLQTKLIDSQAEAKIVRNVKTALEEQYKEIDIVLNYEDFLEEIKELSFVLADHQRESNKIRDKLSEWYSYRADIESQIAMVTHTLGELRSDFKIFSSKIGKIDCPTCGAEYENGFDEIFDIAKDEDRCSELLDELHEKRRDIDKKISELQLKRKDFDTSAAKVKAILKSKSEKGSLEDLIDSESRIKAKKAIQQRIDDVDNKIEEYDLRIDKLKQDMGKLSSKERKAEIFEFFINHLEAFSNDLHVPTPEIQNVKGIWSNIKDQGSDQPRALLAYYYSMLYTMKKYCSCNFSPVVVDAPIQQEQDKKNRQNILVFFDRKSSNWDQTILGVVELYDVKVEGQIITLHNKYSLLNAESFEVNEELYHHVQGEATKLRLE